MQWLLEPAQGHHSHGPDGQIGHVGRGWGGAVDDPGCRKETFKEQGALRQGKNVIRLLQEEGLGFRDLG